jgi:hypothetical protein
MGANTNPKVTSALDLVNALPDRFTSDFEMEGSPGVEVVRSHVQGIARKGSYYLLTHSALDEPSGLLLVATDKKVVQRIRLPMAPIGGAVLNHPGGCQLIGDYLVIPFEAVDRNVSRVSIFDVTSPERPSELTVPAPIERGDRKAGAAGIANLTLDGGERWYLAVYDNGRVDHFASNGGAFPDSEWRFHSRRRFPTATSRSVCWPIRRTASMPSGSGAIHAAGTGPISTGSTSTPSGWNCSKRSAA